MSDRRILFDDIEIKLRLSFLKPLHAKWIMDSFKFMISQAGSKVISNGWKVAGITEVLSKRLSGLESPDPFESELVFYLVTIGTKF